MKRTALLLLGMPALAAADVDPAWLGDALKANEPNEFPYYYAHDDECPFSDEEARKTIEGVIIRSRLKPSTDWDTHPNDAYFNLLVGCIQRQDDAGTFIFQVDARYGSNVDMPPVLFDKSFGVFGQGERSYVLESMKGAVEDAVTPFIEVNFLAP